MLTLSQLCGTIARLTHSDHSHVDQVASYLQKEGWLPSYPEGQRGRPAKEDQIKARAEHAAALITALMVTDRPASTVTAIKLATECTFQGANDTVMADSGSSGSAAYSINEGETGWLSAAYGQLPALTMLGSLILAEQAGMIGHKEVTAVAFMLEAEASFFSIEMKDLSDPLNPDGRRVNYWFCRLGSDMASALRGGIPRFSVTLPGKLIHDIGQALGPLSPEEIESCRQHDENYRAAVAASRDMVSAQPESGAA